MKVKVHNHCIRLRGIVYIIYHVLSQRLKSCGHVNTKDIDRTKVN